MSSLSFLINYKGRLGLKVKVHYYTEDFQKSAVLKYLNRGNSSAESIARDLGISLSSIYGWVKKYGSLSSMKKSNTIRPHDRSPEEKVELFIKYYSLPEEERGLFLRENGLHSHHLEQWRDSSKESFSIGKVNNTSNQDKKKIKELEKELRRKDRALAEAAALLILKKKVDAMWGVDDE